MWWSCQLRAYILASWAAKMRVINSDSITKSLTRVNSIYTIACSLLFILLSIYLFFHTHTHSFILSICFYTLIIYYSYLYLHSLYYIYASTHTHYILLSILYSTILSFFWSAQLDWAYSDFHNIGGPAEKSQLDCKRER